MKLPTPPELAEAPELATLATVSSALELMVRALVVAHPELLDQDRHDAHDDPPPLRSARRIARSAGTLQRHLERYADLTEQLARQRRPDFEDRTF